MRKSHNPNLPGSARCTAFMSSDVLGHMRAIVHRAGQNPDVVPEMSFRFLRPKQVAALMGVHVSTIYRLVEDGKLPRPVAIDRGKPVKSAAPRAAA